ncbi:MAG TPA: CPBP family intramembrane glutamic endopeptidase, partial [Terriglobales bacterium]|nr:CPBP family intramembrane glutamic endopeptidase [Terriglobales bacterium]
MFLINLLLSPLWEEIIWRGYFYQKLGSMLRASHALLVAGLGWAIWHIGFLFYLHSAGIAMRFLAVLAIQLFLVGLVACCVFTLGKGSLLPCVLLHTAFNSATSIYYGAYGRTADIGSYIAETVAVL